MLQTDDPAEGIKTGLIIFIRNPVAGKVKTRIAKSMGDKKALSIYNHLLRHTQLITRDLTCDKFLYYSDRAEQNDDWEISRYQKKVQHGANLGDRMANAFRELFTEGYKKLVVIGSDCLDLDDNAILRAFQLLDRHEVVIGPTSDGGYYLLGMTSYLPQLFVNKTWSSASVFENTLQDLNNEHIIPGRLPLLNDIDEEKDLPKEYLNW